MFRGLNRLSLGGLLFSSGNSMSNIARSVSTQDFQKSVWLSRSFKRNPSDAQKLKLWALQQQAIYGEVKKPRPFVEPELMAKWDTWYNLSPMTKEEAQEEFVEMVQDLSCKLGSSHGLQEFVLKAQEQKLDELLVKKDEGVAKITLNRPTRYNAITLWMYLHLQNILAELQDDEEIKVVVLTGNGKYFCSGNDLANFDLPEATPEFCKLILNDFVNQFINFSKPLIAAVNGPCLGISFTILGLFDLIYCSDDAVFHTPFTATAQGPEACSSYLFPKMFGPHLANEILLFGRKLKAEEAKDRNFVSEIFAKDRVLEETLNRAHVYSKLPPKSLALSRELIRAEERDNLLDVNAKECEVLQGRWASQEFKETVAKFFQSRN